MMLIPKWGNYPGDGGGGITLVIDSRSSCDPESRLGLDLTAHRKVIRAFGEGGRNTRLLV